MFLRMILKSTWRLSLFVAILILVSIVSVRAEDKLAQGFAEPPCESKLWAYWWWLNGNVTASSITRDLEQMKEKGFGGAIVFDANGSNQDDNKNTPPGPMYSSPEWTKLFVHTIQEAHRLGLSISLNIQSGWNLGGPIVTPEFAAKRVVYSTTNIEGGPEKTVNLSKPNGHLGFYRDIAVVAFKTEPENVEKIPFTFKASSHQKNYPPPNAIDGSPETFWVSEGQNSGNGPTTENPEWLEFQFNNVVEIDRIAIEPRSGYGPKQCELLCFDIDSGKDNSVTNRIAAFSMQKTGNIHLTFGKQKGKRFRLNIFSSYDPQHSDHSRNVQIADIALYSGGKRITGKNKKTGKLKLFDIKLAVHEFGGSTPDCRPLMEDEPDQPDDQPVKIEDILVLTEKINQQGTLHWNVPAGNWTVLRFGYTATGARVSTSSGDWQGLVLDHLSSDAFDFYWNKAVKPILDTVKPHCGKSLRYLHTDSWEAGGMNWTDRFREEFQTRRGYDPIPYLPVIAGYILNNRSLSNRFLNDFRRTIGDLIAENHCVPMKKKAADYGIGIHPESGGPHGAPIDSLQLLGISDIPMSEFWSWSPRHRIGDANRFFTKQPASAAHTHSHKLIAAEGFTNIGMHWQESFSHNLKPSFDQAVCEGMNLLVWHTFTCSPDETGFPGQEYFAGTHFNPKNFTWKKSKDFLTYINRIQFLLQQGLPSADVLEYYGNGVPNFTQGKWANTAKSLPGYDYDVASEDVLLTQVAEIRNGRIVLKDGTNYRVLVLPQQFGISREVFSKIKTWSQEGATIIGSNPIQILEPANKPVVSESWTEKTTEKTLQEETARNLLKNAGIPFDFERIEGTHKKPRLEWIHRTVYQNQLDKISFRNFSEFSPINVETVPANPFGNIGAEIYFVANLTDSPDKTVCAFRVTGREPELWDPVSGEIRKAQAFTQEKNRTFIPLEFAPYGSVFVVFRNKIEPSVQGTGQSNSVTFGKIIEITSPWSVRFDPTWGGVQEPVEFQKLESWTKHENPAIRYYSGLATYSQDVEIEFEKGQRIFLEVDNVHELAEVKINNQSCGTIWAFPFRVEITSAWQSGKNRIEIEVANHWANRIIGDAAKPENERLTRTNIQRLTPETKLVDSGLVGTVRLLLKQ
ncbi:MAG: discoidin domain-containing protein [Planctomycetaceae bacterium]|nr:discoidin domain-containing protein [Planctomycetaceae bacterium]